eukprot:COSAG06_NODE_6239_length_3022_cov_1.766678_2_plen_132_part_00
MRRGQGSEHGRSLQAHAGARVNHECHIDIFECVAVEQLDLAALLLLGGGAVQHNAAAALACLQRCLGAKERADAGFADQVVAAGVADARERAARFKGTIKLSERKLRGELGENEGFHGRSGCGECLTRSPP